ncbi:MAG: T9SS type A sorting domain-containing protein [Bacteroidota bacterium]
MRAQVVQALPISATDIEVRWDSLGPGAERRFGRAHLGEGIANQPAAKGDPFADTLFAVDGVSVFRLNPGDAFFGPQFNERGNPSPGQHYFVTAAGTHLSDKRGLNYSPDRGVTWVIPPAYLNGEPIAGDANVNGFFESPTLGVLAAGQGGYLWQSTDEGRTWYVRHDFDIGFSNAYAVRQLAGDTRLGPEASPWAGRLVMSFRGVIRYSDDAGASWQEARGVLNADWDQIEEASDGTLYLASSFEAVVLVSTDGGASWREFVWFRPDSPGDYLDGEPRQAQITVALDGALWVGLSSVDGNPPREGTFVVTRDGGATWTEAGLGFGRHWVHALAFDSAGRLAAATQVGAGRTSESVVVASESEVPEMPSRPELLLSVYPNPASDTVQISVEADAPLPVRVVVADLRGRTAAVVHDSVLTGTRTFAVDTVGWPAGVYVVEVQGDKRTDTRRFTVAR